MALPQASDAGQAHSQQPVTGPPCPHQLIFQVTPLSGRQWGVVLQMSLPVILLDEALKYLSRHPVDGKWGTQPLLLPQQLLTACLCSQTPTALDARRTVGELFFSHEVEGPGGYGARTCREGCLALQEPCLGLLGTLLRATLPQLPRFAIPSPRPSLHAPPLALGIHM